ncbi:hypothetical protein ACLOJK_014750, partial [Asimina triloba]
CTRGPQHGAPSMLHHPLPPASTTSLPPDAINNLRSKLPLPAVPPMSTPADDDDDDPNDNSCIDKKPSSTARTHHRRAIIAPIRAAHHDRNNEHIPDPSRPFNPKIDDRNHDTKRFLLEPISLSIFLKSICLHCCHRRGLDRTIQAIHDAAASCPSLQSPSTAPTMPPPVIAAPTSIGQLQHTMPFASIASVAHCRHRLRITHPAITRC